MQDRFKFRVWDKTREIMVYFDGIFYNKKPYTEGSSFPQYDSCPHYHKLSDLMQCTGLKDKNGKLIYEGDILQYPSDKTRYKLHYETAKAYELYDITHKEKKDDVYFLFRHHDKVEIIGNIWENKDLLKG